MRQIEYRLEELPRGKDSYEITEFLDSMGEDGWELCGIEFGNFIFKRQVQI